MIKYKNLMVIGTSHIAKQSLEEVEGIIKSTKPQVVALELDRNRFIGIHNKELKKKPGITDIKQLGFKGYIFALIGGYVEKKLGSQVGVSPGDEMLKAVEAASSVEAKIALIDQDIKITLKNFSRTLTWKERGRFLVDIIKQLFKGKQKLPFDLRKVPEKELVTKLITKMQERYPNVYKSLVGDRNVYMAKRLWKLMQNYGLIVAVVGVGHEEELIEEVRLIERNKKQQLN